MATTISGFFRLKQNNMTNKLFTVFDPETKNEMEVFINNLGKVAFKIGLPESHLMDCEVISLDKDDIADLIEELNYLRDQL